MDRLCSVQNAMSREKESLIIIHAVKIDFFGVI